MTRMQTLKSRRARQRKPQPPKSEVIVGKDILELLSSAMYIDPLSVIREYVQNAIDAIDQAYTAGILTGPRAGRITINLDLSNRRLRIKDNGIGIRNREAVRILCAFGDSTKRGAGLRGFRGVGRLAGLGYARSVTFRTKAIADNKVVELRWDCRRLKSLLLDSNSRERLDDVVRKVVSVTKCENTRDSQHFFEVELEGVIRIGQDLLLNPEAVERYLRQVAPVPLDPGCRFTPEIEKFLAEFIPQRRARIYLNGSTSALTRPHEDSFNVSLTKTDRFTEVEFLRFDDGSRPTAVGWVLHHGYQGALKGAPEIRGLRARVGDMQVGDGRVFSGVFPEPRFNSWSVGEIHVLDSRIVPNARRDDFEPSGAWYSLLNQLAPVGRELGRRCRVNSQIRNRLKAFESGVERAREAMAVVEQAAAGKRALSATLREIAGQLEELARIAEGEFPNGVQKTLQRKLTRLEGRYRKLLETSFENDALARLPRHKRAAYQEFVGLLYECSRNRTAARLLVDRMTARLGAR